MTAHHWPHLSTSGCVSPGKIPRAIRSLWDPVAISYCPTIIEGSVWHPGTPPSLDVNGKYRYNICFWVVIPGPWIATSARSIDDDSEPVSASLNSSSNCWTATSSDSFVLLIFDITWLLTVTLELLFLFLWIVTKMYLGMKRRRKPSACGLLAGSSMQSHICPYSKFLKKLPRVVSLAASRPRAS